MQSPIDTYFERTATFWDDVYHKPDVWGAIYRRRHEMALSWVDCLRLSGGSRVLEVGCGAGVTAVALAERGLEVEATDPVAVMLERTRRRAAETGVSELIRTSPADAHALDFADETFSLALALGVAPWVQSGHELVEEMARVVKPGGYLLLSADNRLRLTHLLDPACNPASRRLLKPVTTALARYGLRSASRGEPRAQMHVPKEVDGWLSSTRLVKLAGITFGFGPFTMLGRPLLSNRADVRLDRWLDRVADRGMWGIRAAGTQYLVLAQKESLPSTEDRSRKTALQSHMQE